jgi:hypothetical protein
MLDRLATQVVDHMPYSIGKLVKAVLADAGYPLRLDQILERTAERGYLKRRTGE